MKKIIFYIFLFPFFSLAQIPSLIKDINTVGSYYSIPGKYCTLNNVVYFAHTDDLHGYELWRTDGTNPGTFMVKEIRPGHLGSIRSEIVEFKGELYFLAENEFGVALWKSNGTESGTVLIKNFGPNSDSYYLPKVTNCGEYLVFSVFTAQYGVEPWKSNGTTNGTTFLVDINPGAASSTVDEILFSPILFSGNIFFTVSDTPGQNGIWQTSYSCFIGCTALSPPSKITNTQEAKDLFFHFNSTANTFDLYFRDATKNVQKLNLSTSAITPLATFSVPSEFFYADLSFKEFNNIIYFSGFDAVNGLELWKTDGTLSGTSLFKNINTTNTGSSQVYEKVVCNNTMYFGANDGIHGFELWKTDGTPSGTVLVNDILPGSEGSLPYNFTVTGSKFYFKTSPYNYDNANLQLRIFDASTSQLILLKDFTPIPYIETTLDMVLLNQSMIFTGFDPSNGFEVWKSDGTISGTSIVKDISQGSSDAFGFLTIANLGLTYYVAFDGTNNNLWTTDINGISTKLTNVIPSTFTNLGYYYTRFAQINNDLILAGYNVNNNLGSELWKSNGSNAGTTLIKDINQGTASSHPDNFCMAGNILFFSADDGINGEELWKSDGTNAGTSMVKNIDPTDRSSPTNLIYFNGFVYFNAYDGNDRGLWRSDGTEAGTTLVKIMNSNDIENPNNFCIYDNKLYFVGFSFANGAELWVTDGTNAGTNMVKDIYSGTASSSPKYLTATGSLLYFSADNGINGRELWRSDGTVAGTTITNINADPMVIGQTLIQNSDPQNLTAVGNTLFFSAIRSDFTNPSYPYFGRELYTTNGGFVYMVKDANTNQNSPDGISSTFKDKFSVIGGTVFYPGTDGINGTELWRSNGSGLSTFMINDQFSGVNDGMLENSTIHVNSPSSKLYYNTTNGQNGRELWGFTYCPLNVNINSVVATNIQKQQAGTNLTSTSNISATGLTYGNLDINYRAGKSITLQPGFSVEGNKLPQNRKSVFKAEIGGCQ